MIQLATRRLRNAVPDLIALGVFISISSSCTNIAAPGADLPSSIEKALAVKVPFTVPAFSTEAAKIRSIAIVGVSGQGGDVIAHELESALTKVRSDEAPYYSAIVAALGGNPTAEGAALADRARRVGAVGAMTAAVTTYQVSGRQYNESRSECTKSGGKIFSKCSAAETRTFQVSCQERTANVNASVRLIDARSAKTVYADVVKEQYRQATCADGFEKMQPDNILLGLAAANVAINVSRAIAPSIQERPLDLMAADSQIKESARPRFEEAISFAKAKRLDRSCRLFDELYDGEKESIALTYNMGFCAESRGDIVQANSLYKRASELSHGPNSKVDDHMMVTEAFLKQARITGAAAGAAQTMSPLVLPIGALPTADDLKRQKRVALVVGNARYKLGSLGNPVNDARLVEEQLKAVGFSVTRQDNLERARFSTVIRDFVNKSKNADVALFYFAGHAIQENGENVLLPVDNDTYEPCDDLQPSAPSVTSILTQLEAARPKFKIVVLDACRNNPLKACNRSTSAPGLAPIAPPEGTVIVFATQPGQVAADGSGKNSYFSAQFVKALKVPNLRLEDVLKQVRTGVIADTKGKQRPIEQGSLIGDFYFKVGK